MEAAVGMVTESYVLEAFGELSARVKRQLGFALAGLAAIVNFGLGIRNSYELEHLRQTVRSGERTKEYLVKAVDGIVKTQARDHDLMKRIVDDEKR